MKALKRRNQTGNAMVEFIILMPIYLLLLLGAIYMGRVAFFQEKSLEANRLAVYFPGRLSDTEGDSETGIDVHARLFGREDSGELAIEEEHEPVPAAPEIEDAIYPPPRSSGRSRT